MKWSLCISVVLTTVVPSLPAYQPGDSYVPVGSDVRANDIAYIPVLNRLAMTVGAGGTGVTANSLVVVEMATGKVDFSVPMDGEPSVVAVSTDGRYAYVGLVGGAQVNRIDLVARRVDLQMSLGESSFLNYPLSAESIAVAPGNPTRVAVSRKYSGLSPRHAGVVLFDGAQQRPNSTPTHTGANLIGFEGDPTRLYGLNNETTEYGFRTIDVSSAGLTVISTKPVNIGFGASFALDGGRAWFNSGSVFDLTRGVEIGRIELGGVIAPFITDGIVAVVGGSSSFFSAPYELRIYDGARLSLLDRFALPDVKTTPIKLIRVGTQGFALLSSAASGTSGGTVTFLLRDEIARPVLANASTRGVVGAGDDVMIAGFVVQGTAPRSLVIRALGPSLSAYGVPGVLDNPVLELYSGSTKLAENDDWQDAPAPAQSELSRLSLVPASVRESVVARSFTPGAYTAVVRAKAGSLGGVALVEVYDSSAYLGDTAPTTAKTVNISTRARAGTGGNVLIAGFVIAGNLPRRVLINGIGGSLRDFGITDALTNPKLELFSGSRKITEADDWITSAQFDDIVNSGSAPRDPLEPSLLVTLNPGAYTAIISGANGGSGVALAEVYDSRTTQDLKFVRTTVSNSFATLSFTPNAGGAADSLSLIFLTGTTATINGGPLGTSTYTVNGRNTADLNVTASNGNVSGSLRFFRPDRARFTGIVAKGGQGSQLVTGIVVFQ